MYPIKLSLIVALVILISSYKIKEELHHPEKSVPEIEEETRKEELNQLKPKILYI